MDIIKTQFKIYTRIRLIRFIISGGLSALTNLIFLYIFVDLLDIWYLLASSASFLIGFAVSFILQKYWAFENPSKERIHAQVSIYFIVTLINLIINITLVYLFVDKCHINYLLAQIISNILIAFVSYFVYRRIFAIIP